MEARGDVAIGGVDVVGGADFAGGQLAGGELAGGPGTAGGARVVDSAAEFGPPSGGRAAAAVVGRGSADRIARRLLRVPEPQGGEVYNIFSSSILLSATRCLLSYIVFPVLAPWLSEVPVVGPAIGIPVALAALVFDVRAVRRFFLADHRWRWAAALLYVVVMAMVTYLLVRDIVHLT